MWPWTEEHDEPDAIPRLRHWILALMLLIVGMLTVPVFAGLV